MKHVNKGKFNFLLLYNNILLNDKYEPMIFNSKIADYINEILDFGGETRLSPFYFEIAPEIFDESKDKIICILLGTNSSMLGTGS